jgi:hypothetical protein
MPVIEIGTTEGYGGVGFRVARGDYSFAADGGAIGTIALGGSTFIPSGATILGGFLDVTVAVTGGAASIGIQVESAGDIVAVAAISGAPWSTTGRKSIIPAFTGATAVRTTAARDISAVISGATVSAGAFKVVLFYLQPLV